MKRLNWKIVWKICQNSQRKRVQDMCQNNPEQKHEDNMHEINIVPELCQAACNEWSKTFRQVLCEATCYHVVSVHAVCQRHIVHALWQVSWLDQLGPGSGLPEILDQGLRHLEPLMVLQVHHGGPVLLLEGPKLVLPVPAPLPSLVQPGAVEQPLSILNASILRLILSMMAL